MTEMMAASRVVVGGIDTHKDLHVAAVLDTAGAALGTQSFSTTRAGYRALVRWMRSFGDVRRVGIEGTGSYGAGLTRHPRGHRLHQRSEQAHVRRGVTARRVGHRG